MSSDLVIRGGRLVSPHDAFVAHLRITRERIAAIGQGLQAQREIDAGACTFLAGAIDVRSTPIRHYLTANNLLPWDSKTTLPTARNLDSSRSGYETRSSPPTYTYSIPY